MLETDAVERVVYVRPLDIDTFALRSVPQMVGGCSQRDARDHTDEQDEQQQMVCAT
jgi:hypothetical protein